MKMDTKAKEIKQITLSDNIRFSYTVKEVEMTNILGAVVAILDEYFITNFTGENYKLHKTKEGNWYDFQEANIQIDKSVMLALKLGIDQA